AEGLHGDESDRQPIERLYSRLHALAGSAGTFGLAPLTARARTLEHLLKGWLAGSLVGLDVGARTQLSADLDALGRNLLPATDATPSPPPRARTAGGKALRVWLVQADAELAGHLARQLESFGHAVQHFALSAEVDLAVGPPPDILILELSIDTGGGPSPQLDAFARRFVEQAPDSPVILVSPRDDFAARVWASRLGAEGYFLEPVDVPRLVGRISQIFDQRDAPPRRVLVVDDDAALAEHYRLVLLAAGMEADVLRDPEAIIATLATRRPELVLLDLRMPGYSGTDLAGVIRQHERWSSLPIVYLSAETDLDEKIAALSRGADDFLTKPISGAQLVAAVRARIDRARQLDAQISKDSLTGLLKHASIKDALEIEVARSRRTLDPVTVVMLDIDHFKAVNDSHGHGVGDVVISAVATLLRQRLRQSDIVGRYGGEEFVAVLPACETKDARIVIDDIRRRFADVHFAHEGKTFSCTISAGIASSSPEAERSGAELLVAADTALYAAKRSGRNQVRCEQSDA
ncbi:MAG: diguanylate cyclase, partial [Myxococcales bacterium]|nr:diguanylate cyclase [Myxococcales bacterium]